MYRIPAFLVGVLFTVGLAQSQEIASSTSRSKRPETHLLPPSHASVTITDPRLGDLLEGPHWWNDRATYHNIYSHGEVPNIVMVNRDGTVAFKSTLTAPNLDRIRVTDAAATVDGGAVATATIVDRGGTTTSFVAQLNDSGKVTRQITTFPLMAEMTCPAEDGTVWVFGWDFLSDNRRRYDSYSILRHYSFTQGQLSAAVDWRAVGNHVLFGHHVIGGTAVACTSHKAWVYYGERRQFIAYDEESNSLHVYPVQLPSNSPSDLMVSGFARTASGDFYGSLNDGSQVWLGLYRLKLHHGVAEWAAVDVPGDFKNGIRLFGSAGDDLVYARVAWQWPEKFDFSTMPASFTAP